VIVAVDSALWTWQFDLACAPFFIVGVAWIAWKYRRDPDFFARFFEGD